MFRLIIEFPEQEKKLKLIFDNWDNTLKGIINKLINITDNLYNSLNKAKEINATEIQVLFHLKTIFEYLMTTIILTIILILLNLYILF